MSVKKIDFEKPYIEANGKQYKILKELSINRFKELDKMEVEFFYGFDMQALFNKLKSAFEDINKNKLGDAAVKVHNLMVGVADRVDKREHIVLRICSLFLVTDDEDITQWDEDLAKEKAKDWAIEGYGMSDFFSLAATSLPGFLSVYESVTADISEEAAQKKQSKAS